MKRLIIGDGRHGKDTVADILCNAHTNIRSVSSSLFCARLFIFDMMKETHGYKTVEECFNDRHSPGNRKIWHEAIAKYNLWDPSRVAREITKDYDLYVGMRSWLELEACLINETFDLIYWVDAFPRKPRESRDSMKITYRMVCDYPNRKTPLIFVNNVKGGIQNIRFGQTH